MEEIADWDDGEKEQTVMRYRKKPVVVEALRFEDTDECLMALKDNPIIKINTLAGDYVVKGIGGEFYLSMRRSK